MCSGRLRFPPSRSDSYSHGAHECWCIKYPKSEKRITSSWWIFITMYATDSRCSPNFPGRWRRKTRRRTLEYCCEVYILLSEFANGNDSRCRWDVLRLALTRGVLLLLLLVCVCVSWLCFKRTALKHFLTAWTKRVGYVKSCNPLIIILRTRLLYELSWGSLSLFIV